MIEKLKLLILKADPKVKPEELLLQTALKNFPQACYMALTFGDERWALRVYEDVLSLPQGTTRKNLQLQGYEVDGAIFEGNENIIVCFKGSIPCAFKILDQNFELKRFQNLPRDILKTNEYIVPYELVSGPRATYAVMPLYPITLERLDILSVPNLGLLWSNMQSAFNCLHGAKFAHMDVKPPNIAISSEGKFILIDLGSAVQFGQPTSTSELYQPRNLEEYLGNSKLEIHKSSGSRNDHGNPLVDWWMLALVILERVDKSFQFKNPVSNPTTTEVLKHLKMNASSIYPELSQKLTGKPVGRWKS